MQTIELTETGDDMDGIKLEVAETNRKIDGLNREMRAEFRSIHTEVKEEFRDFRGEMNLRFDSLENRVAAMTRTMLATTIGGAFTLLATVVATQF